MKSSGPRTEPWGTPDEIFAFARADTVYTGGDNPTLSANKHIGQVCRSSLSAAADGHADGSGERRTSPVNGIERSLGRAVVPKT